MRVTVSIPELISSTDCPESQRSCCYDLDIDLDSLAVSCLPPDQAEVEVGQTAEKIIGKIRNLRRKKLWLVAVKRSSIRTPAG